MIAELEAAFPRISENGCHAVCDRHTFYAFDPKTDSLPACLAWDKPVADAFVQVENANAKEIHFLAVDNCLFFHTEKGVKKCDFLLWDDKQVCFVELKHASGGSRQRAKRDAYDQLEASLQFFSGHFSRLSRQAYVAVGSNFPRLKARSTNQTKEAYFSERHKAELLEGSLIAFD